MASLPMHGSCEPFDPKRHASGSALVNGPGGIRTHDPRLAKAMLYQAKLQAREFSKLKQR